MVHLPCPQNMALITWAAVSCRVYSNYKFTRWRGRCWTNTLQDNGLFWMALYTRGSVGGNSGCQVCLGCAPLAGLREITHGEGTHIYTWVYSEGHGASPPRPPSPTPAKYETGHKSKMEKGLLVPDDFIILRHATSRATALCCQQRRDQTVSEPRLQDDSVDQPREACQLFSAGALPDVRTYYRVGGFRHRSENATRIYSTQREGGTQNAFCRFCLNLRHLPFCLRDPG